MRYRYQGKTYRFGRSAAILLGESDLWVAEGVARFHLSAMLSDLELTPGAFARGTVRPEAYVDSIETHRLPEGSRMPAGPVVVIEYGPDDWRVVNGFGRLREALAAGEETVEAVFLPSGRAMEYLLSEEDVRHYVEHWNFQVSYWERHDRVNGLLLAEDGPFTEVRVEAQEAWERIVAAAENAQIEIPMRWNRWFCAHGDGKKVLIGEAKYMAPSCPLTFDRPVRRREFLEIFPLYEEWESAADEEPVREKARRITISYEYIFAMIRHLACQRG